MNMDRALPDIAHTFGLKTDHLSTPEEIQEAREIRREVLEAKRLMEAAQVAGQAYPGSTKAPEAGSPAEALIGT